MSNITFVTEFVLLGFPEFHTEKMAFFTLFLSMYLLSLVGHSSIILVVLKEPMLHTPMYFFLANFSMTQICCTTAEVPKMLDSVLSGKNTICFACCMAQGFIVFSMGAVEFITLTIMSFDRYVAICKPLRYKTIMTNQLCLRLALTAWVGGFVVITAQSAALWSYPFCGPNVIDHYFCDVGPVLRLACGDRRIMELVGLLYGAAIMWGSFAFSLISYTCIIVTIIRIPSAVGRSKAFLTCASHLTVVSLLYLILMIMYLRPSTQGNTRVNRILSLVHISFIPMLNPVIYTIRNKDFQAAARKLVRRKMH